MFSLQYGRSDSYRVATTQDKDEKESPKKGKGGKDMDDLKKEVPLVRHIHIKKNNNHILVCTVYEYFAKNSNIFTHNKPLTS